LLLYLQCWASYFQK